MSLSELGLEREELFCAPLTFEFISECFSVVPVVCSEAFCIVVVAVK